MLLKSPIGVYATYQLSFSTLGYHNTFLTYMDIITCSLKTIRQIPFKWAKKWIRAQNRWHS